MLLNEYIFVLAVFGTQNIYYKQTRHQKNAKTLLILTDRRTRQYFVNEKRFEKSQPFIIIAIYPSNSKTLTRNISENSV